MAKRSHEELRIWYERFAKELYEKANIDITRIEDIGRIKNYYITNWNVDEPISPEGEFQYACIAHKELTYDNPPPAIEDTNGYLNWVMDNLQVPTTDDQIEKLMEMSMAGTLMVFAPGAMDAGMQQVYTDVDGRISTSAPLNTMTDALDADVPDHLRLPRPPAAIPPAGEPEDYGLEGCPKKPVRPKNMNPGFFSWLGYKIGINTAYAKKVRYEEEMKTYDKRFQQWFDALDDSDENVTEYKLDRLAREEYVRQTEMFMRDPLAIASAIDNGNRAQQTNRYFQIEVPDENNMYPTMRLKLKEAELMKAKHAQLPQGQILEKLERIDDYLHWESRSKEAMKLLLGHEARPNDLIEYLNLKVFTRDFYKPEKYALPALAAQGSTEQERIAYAKKFADVAEAASFAALAHPDVIGANLREGFSKEDSAKLNYSMLLQNVMAGPRENSNEYMVYLEPARQKGRAAMEAYAKGELEPLAELLRTSIRQTNREAAGLQNFNSSHSLNTLYYIGRMYKLMENDPKLAEAVGLTSEELAETKGNVALHKTLTKGLEAKKLLLEYALYRRNLTPEQLRQAATDVRFASSIAKEVSRSYKAQDDAINNSELYQQGLREMEECAKVSQKEERVKALRKEGKDDLAAQLQAEIDKNPDMILHANNLLILADFDRKACENNEKLADDEWVRSAKAAIAKNCNIDQVTTMKREDLAALISHESDKAFDEAFKTVKPNANARAQEAPVPVNENNGPAMALS